MHISHTPCTIFIKHQSGKGRNTPLINASKENKLGMVKALLKFGADCNTPNEDDSTALLASAYYGHVDIVELLLEAGATENINKVTKLTPIVTPVFTLQSLHSLSSFPHPFLHSSVSSVSSLLFPLPSFTLFPPFSLFTLSRLFTHEYSKGGLH